MSNATHVLDVHDAQARIPRVSQRVVDSSKPSPSKVPLHTMKFQLLGQGQCVVPKGQGRSSARHGMIVILERAIVVFSKKFGNFLFKITILGNLEKIERFVKLQRMHVGTKLAARVDEGPRNSHGGAMRRRRSQCELLLRRRKR